MNWVALERILAEGLAEGLAEYAVSVFSFP
jgi:hypothetical protein